MQEPDWNEVEHRMLDLTLKQLKPVKRLFNGCLGGASSKRETVRTMVNQMRYWWRCLEGDAGKIRVRHVLEDLEKAEEGAKVG